MNARASARAFFYAYWPVFCSDSSGVHPPPTFGGHARRLLIIQGMLLAQAGPRVSI